MSWSDVSLGVGILIKIVKGVASVIDDYSQPDKPKRTSSSCNSSSDDDEPKKKHNCCHHEEEDDFFIKVEKPNYRVDSSRSPGEPMTKDAKGVTWRY